MPSARTKDYVNLLPLSDGGMGTVTLAMRKDGAFQRLYAIKRIHTQFVDDEQFQRMFIDEGRIAGLIRHPNVVSVIDVGTDASGPFMVMDYIEGVSLTRLICQPEELDLRVGLRIMRDVARGLHEAHELVDHQGTALRVIHRDISPQNILVSFGGGVHVTDFGIAKAIGASTRTATGMQKGKFGYMSPEQLRYDALDRRSDLFSFGVVLYELLSGHRLYPGGESGDAPGRILREPAPDLADDRPEVPDALVELLFSLLSKDPEDRPPTAADVATRLDTILADLVAEDGVYDLATYMQERFAEDQEASRTRLAAAIAHAESNDEEATLAINDTTSAEASRPIRTWWMAAVGAVAITTVFLGIQSAFFQAAPEGAAQALPSSSETGTAEATPTERQSTTERQPTTSVATESSANAEPLPAPPSASESAAENTTEEAHAQRDSPSPNTEPAAGDEGPNGNEADGEAAETPTRARRANRTRRSHQGTPRPRQANGADQSPTSPMNEGAPPRLPIATFDGQLQR